MKDSITLALDCGSYVPGDMDGNMDNVRKSIQNAVKAGCDIVCFPEACITGYSSKEISTFTEDSDYLNELIRMSSDIAIAAGGFEDEEGRYITQFILSGGKIIGRYRKTHLGMNETVFTPGDELPVFDIGVCRIGIQLCWEVHFPQITATYRKKGAELILNPTASMLPKERRMSIWRRIIPARADDNRLFYAACNSDFSSSICCGPDGNEIEGEIIGDHLMKYVLNGSSIEKYRCEEETMRNIDYPRHFRPELYDLE